MQISRMSPTIVLLNLYYEGHNPQHLECLLRSWAHRERDAQLHLVLSKMAVTRHTELSNLARQTKGVTLHLVDTPDNFASEAGVFRREPLHRRVAKDYATRLRAHRLMFMYLDAAQFSLAMDLRFRWPLELSGIYFRPSFHYSDLGVEQTTSERVTSAAKGFVIRGALRNPHLQTLFCLDPLATTRLAEWADHTECVFLPEPLWNPASDRHGSPLTDRVDGHRRCLVLFGSLDERKGLRPLLDALEALPHPLQQQLALVLAGRLTDADKSQLQARIALFERRSEVQLVAADELVPEEQIQPLLRSCDLVLATYLRHVGSSGLIVRAAAAGVPVLASDYGLVGAQVRRHRLGLTVDSASSEEIARALIAWLERPDSFPFDAASADRFARENTAEAFAETILSRLLAPAAPRRHGARD
jgi:glycosyltransferase involved in cell wall biosynthesis